MEAKGDGVTDRPDTADDGADGGGEVADEAGGDREAVDPDGTNSREELDGFGRA